MFRLCLAVGCLAAVAAGVVGDVTDLPRWIGLVIAVLVGAVAGLWVRPHLGRRCEQ